jgi:uncharacterized transporter YbjL
MVPQSARFFVIAVGAAFVLALLIGKIGVDMSANPPVYYGFAAGVGVIVAALAELALRKRPSNKAEKVPGTTAPPPEKKQ